MNWLRKASIDRWLIAVGLVLLVVGAKLWLVDYAGSSLPYRDQIDAEGESIIRPWAEERLEASAFFAPHNEHRVVFTKLLSWAGVAINGQWDVYVQLCVNALIHAGLLLLVLRWLRGYATGWRYALLAAMSVWLWVLPLDWENTLGGFQSQVYLVLGFSFLQIWCVLQSQRADWRWWGGHACGLLALGAMASGMLSSVAIIGVLLLKTWRQKKWASLDIASLAVASVWVLLGLLTKVSVVGHDGLKAESAGEFFHAIVAVMTWPLHEAVPWSLVAALPVVAVTLLLVRKKEATPSQIVFLGMVVWLGLTVVATAWLRGNGSPLISRYLTTYYFLLALQGAALAWNSRHVWQRALLALWMVAVVTGSTIAGVSVSKNRLPGIAARANESENLVRTFLATSEPQVFLASPRSALPYPSGEILAERWQHESIQSLMPAAVRKPLAPTPAEHSILDGLPSSPSYPVIASSPLEEQTEPWIWRSARQPATALPILRFRFNGGLGDPESAVSVRIISETRSVEVIPDGPARNRWKTINVMRPSGKWWIEVEDSDTLDRIALTAPVELGWLSWAAEKLIKFHFWWISTGVVILAAGLLETLRRQSTQLPESEQSN